MQLRSIFVKTGAGLPPLITATEPASARATGGFFTRARSGRSPFWALLLMMLERIYSGVAGLLTFVGIGRAYGPAVAGDFAFATSTLMLLPLSVASSTISAWIFIRSQPSLTALT